MTLDLTEDEAAAVARALRFESVRLRIIERQVGLDLAATCRTDVVSISAVADRIEALS